MPLATQEISVTHFTFCDDARAQLRPGSAVDQLFDAHRMELQIQSYFIASSEEEVGIGGLVAVHQRVLSDGMLRIAGIVGSRESQEPLFECVYQMADLIGSGVIASPEDLSASQRDILQNRLGARLQAFAGRMALVRRVQY